MKLYATIKSFTQHGNRSTLSFDVSTYQSAPVYSELKDCEVTIEIKKKRKHRSLDANSYCWILLHKFGEKLGLPKEEVYRQLISDVGSFEIVPVKEVAVEKFCNAWTTHGLGWLTETEPSKLDGFINVLCYYGSSSYNTKEMSRLIEAIVHECKVQEIETMTPQEIAVMIGGEND